MADYLNLYALYTPDDLSKIPELKTFRVRQDPRCTSVIAHQSLPISPGVTTTLLEMTYLNMDRELCHGKIFYTLDKKILLDHWTKVLENHYEVANSLRETYMQEASRIKTMQEEYNHAYDRVHNQTQPDRH